MTKHLTTPISPLSGYFAPLIPRHSCKSPAFTEPQPHMNIREAVFTNLAMEQDRKCVLKWSIYSILFLCCFHAPVMFIYCRSCCGFKCCGI